MERLQKFLASTGVASRRKCEELILGGHVKVNGIVITTLGTKVDADDIIEVDDKVVEKEEKEYYLLNKPREVICSSSDDKGRKTVVDMIETSSRIYPVGRLDYDTTGAILLTNDGEFANIMMHPSYHIEKVYLAKLNSIIKIEDIKRIEEGILLDGKKVIPNKIKCKRKDYQNNISYVEITIEEGINHEVKRIFESCHYEVVKLKRLREGIFSIENLNSGEYRSLTKKEIKEILSLKK